MTYMGARSDGSSYDYSVHLTLKGLEIELVRIQTLLTAINLSGEEDSNSDENGFGWKSVFTGYAFGAVFGLAMGYLVFRTRKPAWLLKLIEGEGHPRLKRRINNTCISYQRRRRN
ncbi:hypothetical protein JCGZ_01415 [Jatropha curcas]|uniref:Uncharacterized protein n=1 Tax=Jatropha curcas TaxID=180498 RepID=A0A067LJR7_JATCU|nr:hypothetical protein JCGZ_01415 [Jatropha curcas]